MRHLARLPLLLLLAGCMAAPLPPPVAKTTTIYVIGRGWHTDIALPADAVQGRLAALRTQFPGVRVLSFGFGARDFVLTHRRDALHMALALLPGPAAILVTALSASPEAAFGAAHVVAFRASQAQADALVAFLAAQIPGGPADALRPIGAGPYPGSLFYASRLTYDLGYTCNTWTMQAASAAGLPVSPDFVLFAAQAMNQARSAQESDTARAGAPSLLSK